MARVTKRGETPTLDEWVASRRSKFAKFVVLPGHNGEIILRALRVSNYGVVHYHVAEDHIRGEAIRDSFVGWRFTIAVSIRLLRRRSRGKHLH